LIPSLELAVRKLERWVVAVLLAVSASGAFPQGPAWPAKPVHIVVSLTPGSATDILARAVSERLSAQLGQPVIVENRPGASTTIAAAFVAKAEPDGYTLLATSSAHTVAPFLYPGLSYDTARDLAGVAPLANLPTVLVVPASKGFRTLADLVAAAHARPGSINFGSAAASTQLNAERFRRSAKMDAVHVPFRGAPEALTEVAAGRIDFYFSPIAPALPLLREGKVLALAVGSSKRTSVLPDLPTTLEAGFPDSDYNFWVGLFAPAKTSRSVIERLHRAASAALQSPEVRERLPKLGAESMAMTPGELDALVRDELATNAVLVKAAKISAN
jgi:tripartite-type tricarboxylate transporter receptor subunit TctC